MILDQNYCEWDTSALMLIFSDNVSENFVYYSHIFPALSILLFVILLLRQDPTNKLGHILAVIGVSFFAWCFSDLVLWADANPDHIMFFWSILIHFELLIYLGALYFVYYFINKEYLNWKVELLLFVLYIPIFLFAHTSLNLVAFDYTNCLKEALEGPLLAYAYGLELLLALSILIYAIFKYIKAPSPGDKKKIFLISAGTLLFLSSFSFGNIMGSIETDYELGQFGLFAAPLFIAIVAYMSITYKTFNLKVIGSELLMGAIILLIVSMLFNTKIEHMRIIAVFTALVTSALGYMLIKSVRKEVQQREQLEILTEQLAKANERLKILDKMKSEFVSIASHQLRSPLTSIRGYASMLAEGSYGKLPDKATEALNNIVDSAKFMALSIEDYLNVSRIEAGNMKYEMSDFNMKELAEKVVDEMRQTAIKKGLVMVFRSDCASSATVNADIGKTRQVIMNLVDNSMKYTPKGTITVVAHDDVKKKKMYITIQDTGVGMSKETQEEVFDKFVRAKNANNVNVTGTGLGLFVAKKMITEMKGRVWAESEGEGKGSTFHIELPLLPGKASR